MSATNIYKCGTTVIVVTDSPALIEKIEALDPAQNADCEGFTPEMVEALATPLAMLSENDLKAFGFVRPVLR